MMYISATTIFVVKLVRINYEKVNIKSESLISLYICGYERMWTLQPEILT